jgi:hypothetical protein
MAILPAMVLGLPDRAAAAQKNEDCYDVAIVARIVRAVPTEIAEDPDVIVMRWPWNLEIETKQIVQGKFPLGPHRIKAVLHSGVSSSIFALLFLRRHADGKYWMRRMSPYVIEDRRARFIIPLAKPLEARNLRPQSWVPTSYQSWLRPIRYRPKDGWWLTKARFLDDDEDWPEIPAGWSYVSGDRLIARRGLYIDDLPALLGDSGRCTPDQPPAVSRTLGARL